MVVLKAFSCFTDFWNLRSAERLIYAKVIQPSRGCRYYLYRLAAGRLARS